MSTIDLHNTDKGTPPTANHQSPSTDVVIKLTNISKKYNLYNKKKDRLKESLHPLKKKYHKDFYALGNINLEVKKGEILGIVGRNGSGKSTLLKIISGILTPTNGNVQVNGNLAVLLELGTGFNPEFTGLENIYFYCSILGYGRLQIDDIVENIIEFADIGDFIHQPLKTYSSGMKARLGFSVSVNVDPDILILDEVLAVGDELFRRKCYAKMEDFFRGRKTILFVSHSAGTVNELCTRAILLDKGEVLLEGPTKLVTTYYQKYLFVKKENAEKVRNEIIQLNKDAELKNTMTEGILIDENNLQDNKVKINEDFKLNELDSKGNLNSNTKIIENYRTEDIFQQKPFFIPDFLPKSTVEYKQYDVDIYGIHIMTLDGKKVNALVRNEEYVISYKVKFNEEFTNINFGMGIKNEKGLSLTWMIYPGIRKYIEDKFIKGSIYTMKWKFKCLFFSGNYYSTVGLRSKINGEDVKICRVVDAFVFKVQEEKDSQKGGIFDSDQTFYMSKN